MQAEWDAAYPCSFELEMRADKGIYTSEKQKPLGHFPIRADLFIEHVDLSREFTSPIARKFKRWNFIEFKAPDDELNIDTFIKGRIYAGLFKISAPKSDGYHMEDISYTFVRQRKPVKLMKRLQEKWHYDIKSVFQGIYYLENREREDFFFQIVVVSELDLNQFEWLGMMRRGITREEFLSFLILSGTLEDAEERRNADTISDVVARANAKMFAQWKESIMMGSVTREFLKELLQDDIQAAIREASDAAYADGRADGRADERVSAELESVRNLMKNMNWTMRDAMNALGITEERQAVYAAKLGA